MLLERPKLAAVLSGDARRHLLGFAIPRDCSHGKSKLKATDKMAALNFSELAIAEILNLDIAVVRQELD